MPRAQHSKKASRATLDYDYGLYQRPDPIMCDHPGCDREAEYRAPKSRDLNEYYNFCLEHVQQYNSGWDFYRNMSEDEIEQSRQDDLTWNRPTKPINSGAEYTEDEVRNGKFRGFNFRRAEEEIRRGFKTNFKAGQQQRQQKQEDDDDIFNEAGNGSARAASPYMRDIQEAFVKLGLLKRPKTFEEISEHYKKLAREYHPDARGGSTEYEDKLKEINQAYTTLRRFRGLFL